MYAIAVSGSNVYVGGYFTDAANIATADYLAKWDGKPFRKSLNLGIWN